MSLSKLDPYATIDFEHDGVIFKLRGMTLREKLKLLPRIQSMKVSEDSAIPTEEMLEIISIGLVGWDNETAGVHFNNSDIGKNIDRLDLETFSAIAIKIISISKTNEEEENK